MRDLASNIGVFESIRPAVNSAATVTGQTVDLRGFDAAAAVVTVGAIASSGNVTVKLQDSDNGTDWDDVVAPNLIGAFPAVLLTNTALRVGYVGGRRYLRAFGTLNSGTSVAYSVAIVTGNATQKPVA
jgi:hypothetical protein